MLVFVNVEVAVYNQGKYLMIVRGAVEDHAAGVLAFPGGGIEYAEMADILEHTAAREVLEETGVCVESIEYAECHSFTTPTGTPVVDIVFVCRYKSGTPTISDAGEVAAVRWMTADDILNDPSSPPWMAPSLELVERKRRSLGW